MDFFLPFWNPLVHLLMNVLRAVATPLEGAVGPGMAGGLAIILFTLFIRLALLPMSLAQIRSQKAMMVVQPELKALQRKFKGDREGMARAQMALYKERGVNPAAGCLPMLLQLPILFAMYAGMLQLSTMGLTLDQVGTHQVENGRVAYAASRSADPLPYNQFVLARLEVVPQENAPIVLDVPQDGAAVSRKEASLLAATQGLTLIPGQSVSTPSQPGVPAGQAALYLRPAGHQLPDGTFDRNVPVQVGQPFLVEVEVNAPQTHVDAARVVVTFDPALAGVASVQTPPLEDIPFKSSFLWLPSLGESDVLGHLFGFPIPGFLLILMTISSYVSQRMVTTPTDDPQQQAMMRTMAFMPLMYLFFFIQTPAGLVLYWLVSNLFTTLQQYFTTGLGLFAGDLERLTGRDFQPPWAHARPAAASTNGRVEEAGAPDQRETAPPGQRQRHAPQSVRRAGAAAGKGRKRGKR